MSNNIRFTRVSDAPIDNLDSFILEADMNGKQVADVLCLDGKWYVTLMTEDGTLRIAWEDFLTMTHQFAEFVAQENEIMLREAREKHEAS